MKRSEFIILTLLIYLFYISFIQSLIVIGINAAVMLLFFVYDRQVKYLWKWLIPVLPFVILMALPLGLEYLIYRQVTNSLFYYLIMSKVILSAFALGWVVERYSALFLVDGLLHIGFPAFLNRILALTFRYFYMIQGNLTQTMRALNLRGFQHRSLGGKIQATGEVIGGFFIQSSLDGQRVYQAMKLRGFSGERTRKKAIPWQRISYVVGLSLIFLLFVYCERKWLHVH